MKRDYGKLASDWFDRKTDLDQPILVGLGWLTLGISLVVAVFMAAIFLIVVVWSAIFPPDPNVVCIRHEQVPMFVGKAMVMVDHCAETGRIVR